MAVDRELGESPQNFRRLKLLIGNSPSVFELFYNEPVSVVNSHHTKPFVTDGGKAVRSDWLDDDDVAGARNNLLAIDHHCCLAGENDASLGVGMLVQTRALPRLEVAQKEGNPGAIGLAFKFDAGDFAFPLIFRMQDVKHLRSSRYRTFELSAATPEVEAEPV